MGLHSLITTPLLIGDYVYGVGSYGELRGLNARTGERVWISDQMVTPGRWGTAFMVKQGDRYFVQQRRRIPHHRAVHAERIRGARPHPAHRTDQQRRLPGLAASSTGSSTWSHPAYANRHIVHRNDNEIIRASLAASDY